MENDKKQSSSDFDNYFIKKGTDVSANPAAGYDMADNAGGTAGDPPMKFSSKDRIFVFISLALGFLLFEFIVFEGFGISLPIYMALFYATVFWYFSGKPGGIDPKGLPLLLPIALLSASFALYDNMPLSMLNFMLLFALVILQLATTSGNRLYKTFSIGLAIDLLHAGLVLPLANIPAPFRAFGRKQSAPGKTGRASFIFIGIAISLPILAVVLSLLSSADLVFEKGIGDALAFLNQHIMEYVLKVIFGILFAIPLFGLLYALRTNKKIDKMKFKIDIDRVKFINESIVNTVLILLSAVYIVFIAVQFGYLLNAFSSILPKDFTYAGYARHGFFELMGVSFINLCVLAASLLFSKRGRKGEATLLKSMETALVALTLFLIASAMAKMVMYMDAYGLTLTRVYAAWFMILCAVFFIGMLVKLYVRRFALVRFCGISFLVLFLALNFANADGRIAQYNIERYTSGKSKTVDMEMFYNLSDSMVPYAATLLEAKDKSVSDKVKELLADRASILNDNRWQIYSVARQNAKQALISRGIAYVPRPGSYD